MKSLKNFVLFLAILFIPGLTCAQIQENNNQAISSKSNQLKSKLSGKKYFMPILPRGSHFLNKEFLPGTLTLENGEVYDSIIIGYNSYLDELVCFNSNINSLFIIDKFLIKEFELNSPSYGFQKFRKIKFTFFPEGDRYFQVLYENYITLLVYNKTEEKKVSLYKDHGGNLRNTEFFLTQTFYIYSPDRGFYKFSPTRRSLLNYYSNNKKEVRQLFRKNGLYNFDIPKLKRAFSLIEKTGIRQ